MRNTGIDNLERITNGLGITLSELLANVEEEGLRLFALQENTHENPDESLHESPHESPPSHQQHFLVSLK